MSGPDDAWSNATSLTLSFAPDGTPVTGQPSSSFTTFGAEHGLTDWQTTVARAFQTWARLADINVGVVADGGQPLGIQGSARADDRFGDIRVASIPLAPDTMGEAIGNDDRLAGTWAGDLLFNAASDWSQADSLASVALHEAGHVLGLEHSGDPASPMHEHGVSQTAGPTAADIAALQSLYGLRRPDAHEGSSGNETVDRATRIPHAESADGFTGTTPLLVLGDVLNAEDTDVFLLPVLNGYQGPLTIALRTSGISLLQGRLRVLDRNGVEVGSAISSSALGDRLTVHLAQAASDKYYLEVAGAGNSLGDVGAYAVSVTYDSLLTIPAAEVELLEVRGFQWHARTDDSAANVDVRRLLSDGAQSLDDETHADDSVDKARRLTPVRDSAGVRRFQWVGTTLDATDVDVIRIRSQDTPSATRGLTVSVESLAAGGLIPQVEVRDKNGALAPQQLLVNGHGQVVVRTGAVNPNEDYFIAVSGVRDSVGDYQVSASFDERQPTRTEILRGTLGESGEPASGTLYVARPQLFNFALRGDLASPDAGATLWASVVDDAHRAVAFLGGPVGELRTGQSVLLEPGEYHLLIEGRSSDGGALVGAPFFLFGDALTDPVGPPLLDPGQDPLFVCDPLSSLFCYPTLPPTTSPYGIVAEPPPTTGTVIDPIEPPVDIWFWATDYLPTNPIQPLDVNADTSVSPIDALLVVNYLNSEGPTPDPLPPRNSNYLDPNNDGSISPLDALLVINRLNQGEGEASVDTARRVDAAFQDFLRQDAAWLDGGRLPTRETTIVSRRGGGESPIDVTLGSGSSNDCRPNRVFMASLTKSRYPSESCTSPTTISNRCRASMESNAAVLAPANWVSSSFISVIAAS